VVDAFIAATPNTNTETDALVVQDSDPEAPNPILPGLSNILPLRYVHPFSLNQSKFDCTLDSEEEVDCTSVRTSDGESTDEETPCLAEGDPHLEDEENRELTRLPFNRTQRPPMIKYTTIDVLSATKETARKRDVNVVIDIREEAPTKEPGIYDHEGVSKVISFPRTERGFTL
jgi:hypothetical protein